VYENALYAGLVRFTWLLQWRTVARPVNIAQASPSRLGEMKQGARLSFYTKGRLGDSLNFWASRQLAPARGISLKRDPALLMPLLLCSCLGEGGARLSEHLSPERDPSAWARCWARPYCIWMSVVPEWSVLAEYDCMMNDMYMMEHEVCLAWFMNCIWRVGFDIGMWNEWVVWT